METKEIVLRLTLAFIISGVIGFEREKNQSHAGIKTHLLVGISAALIAVIQSEIGKDALEMARANPDLVDIFRADPARLTAQVISGIGFLGAGTIIVTKRSVSGLTTAASIWSVACLGIAVGMGYFNIALTGFLIIASILFILKRFVHINTPTVLIIKYFGGTDTIEDVKLIMKDLNLDFSAVKYDAHIHGERKIYTTVFEIKSLGRQEFDKLLEMLSRNDDVLNCEKTMMETL